MLIIYFLDYLEVILFMCSFLSIEQQLLLQKRRAIFFATIVLLIGIITIPIAIHLLRNLINVQNNIATLTLCSIFYLGIGVCLTWINISLQKYFKHAKKAHARKNYDNFSYLEFELLLFFTVTFFTIKQVFEATYPFSAKLPILYSIEYILLLGTILFNFVNHPLLYRLIKKNSQQTNSLPTNTTPA